MPMRSAFGRGRPGIASASAEGRHGRDVVARDPLVHVPPRDRRVEDRHDLVAAVADDAPRGLGVVWAELALGQDHEPAPRGRFHRSSWAPCTSAAWSRKGNAPGARTGGVGDFGLVPHTGFEPVISALRGRRPGPLDECGRAARTDPSEPRPGPDATRAPVALANRCPRPRVTMWGAAGGASAARRRLVGGSSAARRRLVGGASAAFRPGPGPQGARAAPCQGPPGSIGRADQNRLVHARKCSQTRRSLRIHARRRRIRSVRTIFERDARVGHRDSTAAASPRGSRHERAPCRSAGRGRRRRDC